MWSDRTLRRLGTTAAVVAALSVMATDHSAPPAAPGLPAAHEAAARAGDVAARADEIVRQTGGVVVLDPFTTAAGEVAALQAMEASVACQLRVDVWEPDLPDAARFPPSALGALTGAAPGERRLDPRAWPEIAPVLSDRLRLCRDKGFDAVDLHGEPLLRQHAMELALEDGTPLTILLSRRRPQPSGRGGMR